MIMMLTITECIERIWSSDDANIYFDEEWKPD